LEVLDLDERIILKWIFKKLRGVIDWIDMAQDRYRWRAPMNAAIKYKKSVDYLRKY
jgi:hypothetical protein